uniref:G-protein coupled receptors family 2 profile 1 domain-containing protein n=1 Tax=Neogobius melanostomus TaxID=47308 RepID=A0A8C6WMC2_9GOBI
SAVSELKVEYFKLRACNLYICVSGRLCAAEWDGFLCWEHTPAGGVASQKCPASDWTGDPTGEHCPALSGNVVQNL